MASVNVVRIVLLLLAGTGIVSACLLRSGPLLILALAIWFFFIVLRGRRAGENFLKDGGVAGTFAQVDRVARDKRFLLLYVGLMGVGALVAIILTALWYGGSLVLLFVLEAGIILLTIGAIVVGLVVFARRVRGIYESDNGTGAENADG
ncbi:MAG TPA: hypothetical protein VGM94_05550 [Galbitalea sp.]